MLAVPKRVPGLLQKQKQMRLWWAKRENGK